MIIETLTELKKYLPVTTLKDVDITDAHQQRAWLKYFTKFLGRDLMDLATGETPPTGLLDKIKPALANFTILEAIPFLDLVLTGSGFGIVSNSNLAPASAERVKNLAEACLMAGNDGLDDLLYWLEKSEDAAIEDAWNKATVIENGIIRNATEFQAVADINESRVRFYSMRTALINFQRKRIQIMLGKRQLDELLLQRTDTELLQLLSYALAHYALSTEDRQHYDTADSYMRLAIGHIRDNILSYPLYAADVYEAPHENTEDTAFLVFGL